MFSENEFFYVTTIIKVRELTMIQYHNSNFARGEKERVRIGKEID